MGVRPGFDARLDGVLQADPGYNGQQIRYLNERLDGNFAEVRTMLVSKKLELSVSDYLLNTPGGCSTRS
jgi:hypothetical protein